MKFHIRRTSAWEAQPCEEAFIDIFTVIDIRNMDDFQKTLAFHGQSMDWWYGEGENHRVKDGRIERDFPGCHSWFVEIDSLDALLEFIGKYKRIVIEPYPSNHNELQIEIYDDYRE